METLKKLLLHPAVPIVEAVIDGVILFDLLPMCAFFGPVLVAPLVVAAGALVLTGLLYIVKPDIRHILRWVLRGALAIPLALYALIYLFLGILYFVAKGNA